MRLDDLKTAGEVLAEHLEDPEFAAEWERTSLAREVATALVAYRAEHDLTQAEVGRRAGLTQPQVARLEAGEREPRLETLERLARALDIRLRIDIGPATAPVIRLDATTARRAQRAFGRQVERRRTGPGRRSSGPPALPRSGDPDQAAEA
jgi:transcriptional regulator with XRE-family HTH domain